MCKRWWLSLFVLLSFLSPVTLSAQSSSQTISEQMQSQSALLIARLLICKQDIKDSKDKLAVLNKALSDSKELTSSLKQQVSDLEVTLAKQIETSALLSKQLKEYEASQLKSKIETGLIAGGVGLAVGAIATIVIVAVIKR